MNPVDIFGFVNDDEVPTEEAKSVSKKKGGTNGQKSNKNYMEEDDNTEEFDQKDLDRG